MPIGITDDHVELADAFGKWAGSLGGIESARAAEGEAGAEFAGITASVAEMGLPGIAVPESAGGAGGTLLDLAVAVEAAAYALVPGPLLGTLAASVGLGNQAAPVAAGEMRVGFCLDEHVTVANGRVTGDLRVVHDAVGATHALVLDDDETAYLVPLADASVTPRVSPDLTRRTARVVLEEVDAVVVPGLGGTDLRRLIGVLAAAEASGVARWCLDTAVEYAGVREQFGQKIGGFQAIKHLCVEMLETSECVTAVAWDAARADAESAEQSSLAATIAGVVACDGAVEVAQSCIQVLGGIGFTFEHDAHLYLRRALSMRSMLAPSASYAGALAVAAQGGARRSAHVDLGGLDDLRERVREDVGRIAALPQAEQRVALADAGLLAPHWPAPYGRDAEPAEQLVIDEELAAAHVERPDLWIGGWAAPTILAHGSEEQRRRFVAPTLRGEIAWCQLFSEPGAGSDLASLRTKAVRDSRSDGQEGWRLTGQKVWTSTAKEADWAICLARTSTEGKPHAGISYFLVDMTSDGIDIRPLREMTGDAMFNEVFLDSVFVPDDCVVGEVGGGWKLARTTLANERVAMAGTRLGVSVERAIELLGGPSGTEWTDRREAVGRAVALATVVKLLGTRATLRSIAGQGPGPESSVAKLVGVRSRQDSAELVVELLGSRVFTDEQLAGEALHEQLLTRCLSIAGGTTQVLRNVAGERILGLPRG